MHITKSEGKILKTFLNQGKQCFTPANVRNEFSFDNQIYLSQLLLKMVQKGSLIRLSKGLYYIVPLGENPEYFIPNWHLVVKYLIKDRKYYIAYYSALQIHNLITQASLTEYIVTDVQIKENKIKIKNADFQFIFHNSKKFFGFKDIWINDHDKVKCSDLEKTLVDCLINTNYAGGILEIGKTLYKAKNNINYQKILDYFNKVDNNASMKRFGFLCEVLIKIPIIEEIKQKRINSISLLDISQANEGKINTKWGLKINFDLNTLEQGIFT
ncbi:MAG: transcriptional regulator [Cyanobacteriota bacterium]